MDRVRGGASLLTFLVPSLSGACYDLTVTNPNAPDAAGAVASPQDAMGLIGSSFGIWFDANYSYFGVGMALSSVSFQHTSPWACCGMETSSRIPRIAYSNSGIEPNLTRPWERTYQAIRAASDGPPWSHPGVPPA